MVTTIPPGIEPTQTLFAITERYPATLAVLIENGFPKLRDPTKRAKQGKALTLAAAAQLRGIDVAMLQGKLAAAITDDVGEQDATLAEGNAGVTLFPKGDLRVSGLLPCPVRIPILEAISALGRELEAEDGTRLGHSLAAASVGADGLLAQIAGVDDVAELPDVFVSAGFESFFDRRALARFKDAGAFIDVGPAEVNADFADLPVKDPDGHFTMIAVVPAVFVVNHTVLGDLPAPRSFEALLEPRYTDKVALPVGDFDLFNALLLDLRERYGDDAVEALAGNMVAALHPSQTVGRFAGRQPARPAVSVVPWFFSRMTLGTKHMEMVWPEDGAVLSPIFALVRADGHRHARRAGEIFASKAIGEVLAHKGLFPSLHPEVDNRLPEGARFSWLGWEYVHKHDIGALIPQVRDRFEAKVAACAAESSEASGEEA
ncbi:MAG: iron ABC transporter substrate-binding protein [Proteobacteria bacterium]|nr:MAG: iron ABC transporter substrate-binding protein [Pseudomonadota bacterium]PIE18087.1 MAG: iron ABC transporter substrate-binding protein [Pseudomonadota bacterium]